MRPKYCLVICLSVATGACARAEDSSWQAAPGGAAGDDEPLAPPVSSGGSGGADASSATGGTGLTSSSFGDDDDNPSQDEPEACVYELPPSCDWSRVEGCCAPYACERASGTDVFNTYPVESCQALVACVQANPGCSTASDPLCFQNEDPSAPCLLEGYQASHNDPDGPFAWTAELVRCVCGY